VFGNERPPPDVNHGAGIDVSPAVRDYLGLGSLGVVDWRFVEQAEIPAGPWLLYDRQRKHGHEATTDGWGNVFGARESGGRARAMG
jgi:hypothetical protein